MWAQVLAALVGVWLMASPSVLDFGEPASTNNLIAGPVVVSMAVIAIWEVTRELRWVNVAIGVWLLLAPWILGFETEPVVNSLASGVVLIGLSLVRGAVNSSFGGGWKALFKDDPPDSRPS